MGQIMKGILTACAIALTAGAASAGTITVNNYGWYDLIVEVERNDEVVHAKFMHLGGHAHFDYKPGDKLLVLVPGPDITRKVLFKQENADENNITVTARGTIFNPHAELIG